MLKGRVVETLPRGPGGRGGGFRLQMPHLIETSFDNTKDKYLILGCPNIAAFGML